MRILYDCFSCSPYYGSDEGIGWMWPYLMSEHHEVWALVRSDRREDIERFCKNHPVSNLHFVYCDIPDWMNIYYYYGSNKTSAMRFLIYQYLWQYAAIKAAKKLHKKVRFDLVHHVCTNDFRLLGFMYQLGIPYIIGPIGGAQEAPEALEYYVRDHRKSEMLRSLINRVFTSLPSYQKALNKAEKVYVSNRETMDYLKNKIRDTSKLEQMTEVAYLEKNIPEVISQKEDREAVFLWAGRMEYRKGLELLIDAAKRLPLDLGWKIILCGTGTEKEKYVQLVEKAGLKNRILFMGKLPYEEVQAMYQEATAFVFPSLRETTGSVIIEAMANGVPVITLNQGGGAYVVNEDCGWLVDGTSRDDYVDHFAKAMTECITSTELAEKKGKNACMRIQQNYTWEKNVCEMSQYYISFNKRGKAGA